MTIEIGWLFYLRVVSTSTWSTMWRRRDKRIPITASPVIFSVRIMIIINQLSYVVLEGFCFNSKFSTQKVVFSSMLRAQSSFACCIQIFSPKNKFFLFLFLNSTHSLFATRNTSFWSEKNMCLVCYICCVHEIEWNFSECERVCVCVCERVWVCIKLRKLL